MTKRIKNMNGNQDTQKPEAGTKIRTTISIDDDLMPKNSERVRERMKERRAANFSNFCEILVAEDCGLKMREAVPA